MGGTGLQERGRSLRDQWASKISSVNLNLALYCRSESGGNREVSHSRERKQEKPTLGSIEFQGQFSELVVIMKQRLSWGC